MVKLATRCKSYFNSKFNKRSPIHPLWLELADKELQEEFDLKQSNIVTYRLKVCVIIVVILLILQLLLDSSHFGQNLYELVTIFSLVLIMTAFCVIGSCCPRVVKYFTLFMFVSRCAIIYLMFKLIEMGKAELSNDKKLMTDAVTSVFFPWFVIILFDPRIDLYIAPLIIIANTVTIAASFDEDGSSMACFHDPSYFKQL